MSGRWDYLVVRKLAVLLAMTVATGCAGSSGGSTDAKDAPAGSPHLASRAVHYLRQNFRGTSWLGDVKRVAVTSGDLYITTDLYPDGDAKVPAQDICNAIDFWPPAPSVVHVVSTTGKWIGC